MHASLAVGGLIVSAFLGAMVASGPTAEPSDRFYLMRGEQRIDVTLGKDFTFEVDGKPVTMRLGVEPLKLFATDDFSFGYPRDMSFAYDGEEPASWDLDTLYSNLALYRGEEFEVKFTGRMMENMYASMAADRDANVKGDAVIKLGGKECKGSKLTVETEDGGGLVVESYLLPAGEAARRWYLTFQYGTSPEEMADAKRIRGALESTWKFRQ